MSDPICINCRKLLCDHYRHTIAGKEGKVPYCHTFDEVNNMKRGDERIWQTYEVLTEPYSLVGTLGLAITFLEQENEDTVTKLDRVEINAIHKLIKDAHSIAVKLTQPIQTASK